MNQATLIAAPAVAAILVAAGLAGAITLVPNVDGPTSLARGEALYERCVACHSLGHDRTGPRHCGLIGRKAGSVPGFEYSEAMSRSGITWSAQALDRFLEAPTKVVPGTSMGYAGIPDPDERRDLIAWLAAARCPENDRT
jgi:cytochrome c